MIPRSVRAVAVATAAMTAILSVPGSAQAVTGSLVVDGIVVVQNPQDNKCYHVKIDEGQVVLNMTSGMVHLYKKRSWLGNCSARWTSVPSERQRIAEYDLQGVTFTSIP
jgi:hypothetical protein